MIITTEPSVVIFINDFLARKLGETKFIGNGGRGHRRTEQRAVFMSNNASELEEWLKW